jgi:hypothetical protein
MRTIELADHELSVTDYSNFELNLMLKGGRITGTVKTFSVNGTKRIQVANPVIMFDETESPNGRIEKFLMSFGFRQKS